MYVFLLFSSPCPIFQLHMMCPGLAMATVQGEHPSIFSFLSVPLSKTHAPLSVGLFFWVIWPFLCPTFCWIIWAYLAVGADSALDTLTDSSPAFSRPVFPPHPTPAFMREECKRIYGNDTTKMYQDWKMPELNLNFFSLLQLQMSCTCTHRHAPFSAWQKGQFQEWTEEAHLFKTSCNLSRRCRGAVPCFL